MTATAIERLTTTAGLVPARGTYPVAANKLILKGTQVCINASGYAVPGVDGEGFAAVGKASSTVDNRTGSEAGGGNGDIDVEVEFGVHGYAYSGTVPKPGQTVFVVDNQTVSSDSDSGQRGIAGACSEIANGEAFVWQGPHVAGLFIIDSAEAADLDQAQTDITNLQADAAIGHTPIPLASGVTVAGDPLVAKDTNADGLGFTEGIFYEFDVADKTGVGYSIALPQNLDDASDVEVHFLVSRVGAADADATLDVTGFFQVAGVAMNADSDVFGAAGSVALDGTTLLVYEEVLTIDAADVPAAPCQLSLTITPASTLDADNARIHSIWLEYPKALTS